jgi:hypothetical protein
VLDQLLEIDALPPQMLGAVVLPAEGDAEGDRRRESGGGEEEREPSGTPREEEIEEQQREEEGEEPEPCVPEPAEQDEGPRQGDRSDREGDDEEGAQGYLCVGTTDVSGGWWESSDRGRPSGRGKGRVVPPPSLGAS